MLDATEPRWAVRSNIGCDMQLRHHYAALVGSPASSNTRSGYAGSIATAPWRPSSRLLSIPTLLARPSHRRPFLGLLLNSQRLPSWESHTKRITAENARVGIMKRASSSSAGDAAPRIHLILAPFGIEPAHRARKPRRNRAGDDPDARREPMRSNEKEERMADSA